VNKIALVQKLHCTTVQSTCGSPVRVCKVIVPSVVRRIFDVFFRVRVRVVAFNRHSTAPPLHNYLSTRQTTLLTIQETTRCTPTFPYSTLFRPRFRGGGAPIGVGQQRLNNLAISN